MATKVSVTNLQASTIDILNVIRQNASLEYQNLVNEVANEDDVRKVGNVLMGYPTLANQFINALVNRIAAVKIKSAVFNNAYAQLKKGYIEYGETIEEIFVNITKAVEFDVEKAPAREWKRTLPDVRTAFHVMNYRVMYPITIQDRELQRAFMSLAGVQDLIARIVSTITTAAEYDEFLLFKYLIIKGVTRGKMYPIKLGDTPSDAAIAFRANSNALPFMNNLYNAEHVLTSTPKNKQIIFMDAQYNAEFDVNVLASAFNMEKTDFMGRLMLIDSFSTFDNDRFSIIVDNSEQMELVTEDELNLMKDVKAIIIDSDWFQVYDNQNRMTETYVSSGLYWNYFYHVWKTVSYSPFANALVFVANTATITAPETLEFVISEISTDNRVTVLTFEPKDTKTLSHMNYQFVQTKSDAQAGIAVHKYGAVIVPSSKVKTYTPTVVLDGVQYQAEPIIDVTKCTAGQEITCNKSA